MWLAVYAVRYDAGMCSNYLPVTRMDRMLTVFGVERERDEVLHDVFPTGLAPFIRRAESGSGNQRVAGDGASACCCRSSRRK